MRRTVASVLILTLVATVLASNISAAARPNLIIILTDDQDLSSLAYMPKTLELLGAQGMTFRNYFVPLSLCCPSRATLLTGLYAHNHKVYTNFPPDGGFERFAAQGHEEKTLATALHDAGYRTALLGKYLNGYPKATDPSYVPPGWDEWDALVAEAPAGGGYIDYALNENGRRVGYGSEPEDYSTNVLSAKATDFIARTTAADQPFFLYLAPFAPHAPSIPATRHAEAFAEARVPR